MPRVRLVKINASLNFISGFCAAVPRFTEVINVARRAVAAAVVTAALLPSTLLRPLRISDFQTIRRSDRVGDYFIFQPIAAHSTIGAGELTGPIALYSYVCMKVYQSFLIEKMSSTKLVKYEVLFRLNF